MILAIRASSLAELFDCAYRWKAIHMEGRKGWTSGPAWLGTSLHYGTAAFDQAVVERQPISIDDATDIVLHKLSHPEEEVRWDNQLTLRKAKDLAIPLTIDYCDRISPMYTFETVELKLEPLEIDMNNGVTIRLTGTADRVRIEPFLRPVPGVPVESPVWWDELEPSRGIVDVKSGRQAIKNGEVCVDKHVAQVGTYELLEVMVRKQTSKEMTLPAQIIALPTSGAETRVMVGEMDRPSRVLLGEGDHMGLLRAAAKMAEHDLFPGNPKSNLCGPKYCPVYPCWWTGKQKS